MKRFALRNGADAVCEKPLVLNPWNIDGLAEMEADTGSRVYNILQLRLHPALVELKQKIDGEKGQNAGQKHEIDLTYITSRGRWYFISWKGDESKAGGIATNIGIHFFDMLIWIFGKVQINIVHVFEPNKAAGFLELENARVRWFLSVDEKSLPGSVREAGQRTYRSIILAKDSQTRARIIERCRKRKIPTAIYYPTPLHLQTAFKDLGYALGDFPAAEDVAARIFSLPIMGAPAI